MHQKTTVIATAALLLLLAGIVAQRRYHFFSHLYDSFILDNKNHYLSCEELPEFETVRKTFDRHRETAAAVEQVGATIGPYPHEECTGKGDIFITYGAHNQRVEIEKIIGQDFFGIPVRMRNY